MPTERTPEEGVPFLEQLKRLLPSMLGGRPGDQRLPMEAGGQRDPRLGQGSILDAIRNGADVVQDLGRQPQPQPGQSSMAGLLKAVGRK